MKKKKNTRVLNNKSPKNINPKKWYASGLHANFLQRRISGLRESENRRSWGTWSERSDVVHHINLLSSS
jgi:hypothetical protein